MVGVRFGHQVIAEALGGESSSRPRAGARDCIATRSCTAEPWINAAAEIAIPASHQDQVVRSRHRTPTSSPQSEFTPLARSHGRDRPAISFQFHPEFAPEFAKALIEKRYDIVPEPDAAIASLDAPNDNARVGGGSALPVGLGARNLPGDEMKTRAAVAFEAKKPLEIVELDLEGPKQGEVLVEIMATGICHTDAYTLDGLDSEGFSRRSSGMKARASSARSARA